LGPKYGEGGMKGKVVLETYRGEEETRLKRRGMMGSNLCVRRERTWENESTKPGLLLAGRKGRVL